jgi:phosphoribosylpyrophosphate synthetase
MDGLGKAKVGKFSNGETMVEIEESTRDCDVFLIQPTCNPNPNDNLMELLIMADACRVSINNQEIHFSFGSINSKIVVVVV